jgi:hypothetical protein
MKDMKLWKRVYVRPNTEIPFYGSPDDPSQERKDSLSYIINFFKNTMGFGDRYNIVYYSPDPLSAFMTCEMNEEEKKLLEKIRDDKSSLYYKHIKLHDHYHKENGIKFVYVDPITNTPTTNFI